MGLALIPDVGQLWWETHQLPWVVLTTVDAPWYVVSTRLTSFPGPLSFLDTNTPDPWATWLPKPTRERNKSLGTSRCFSPKLPKAGKITIVLFALENLSYDNCFHLYALVVRSMFANVVLSVRTFSIYSRSPCLTWIDMKNWMLPFCLLYWKVLS